MKSKRATKNNAKMNFLLIQSKNPLVQTRYNVLVELKGSIQLCLIHPDSWFFWGSAQLLSYPSLSPGFKLGLYQIQTLQQSVGHYMNRNWTLSQSFSVPTWANNCSQWRALTRSLQAVWAWSSPLTQTQHKPGGKCCATEITLNIFCPLPTTWRKQQNYY